MNRIKKDINEYLKPSEVIDFENEAIIQCAKSLVKEIDSEELKIKTIYEFVRDKICHTFDIKGNIITCKASDVLKYGQGICYAKAHLLAALLRSLGIPTGFCYQKLIFSEEIPKLVLHGLNSVYIKSLDQWIRLDARGNKEGVNAQFSLEKEMLAFPVRTELGEVDGEEVYAEPSVNVIITLEKSSTVEELERDLPTEV
ncbi:MAG: transglutaminase family protein [Eubacteriales bacterium]|nr:transglutaminase family protein [Eubacteriales bacterium]